MAELRNQYRPHACRGTLCRKHCYFAGRVQGVGFRYTARNLALNFDIGGFVRNLPDGRVELVVEGCDAEIGSYLEALNAKMSGFIRKADAVNEPATGEFQHSFQITY
jgi:acylphosphatase